MNVQFPSIRLSCWCNRSTLCALLIGLMEVFAFFLLLSLNKRQRHKKNWKPFKHSSFLNDDGCEHVFWIIKHISHKKKWFTSVCCAVLFVHSQKKLKRQFEPKKLFNYFLQHEILMNLIVVLCWMAAMLVLYLPLVLYEDWRQSLMWKFHEINRLLFGFDWKKCSVVWSFC